MLLSNQKDKSKFRIIFKNTITIIKSSYFELKLKSNNSKVVKRGKANQMVKIELKNSAILSPPSYSSAVRAKQKNEKINRST
jgi:hypothetical protein